MKTNRIVALLAVLCLITTCFVGTTLAKYITSADSSDVARVAKWGVTVETTVDGAFATEYDADGSYTDANAATIAKTVVSSDTDKLVAPGTDGDLASTTITGTPEVAVNVKKVATLALTGWEITYDDDDDPETPDVTEEYCPIIFTVNGDEYKIDGTDITDIDGLIEAVEEAVEADVNYQANTNLATTDDVEVSWAWPFYVDDATDVKDTALGDKAVAGDITIEFELETTVTQLD